MNKPSNHLRPIPVFLTVFVISTAQAWAAPNKNIKPSGVDPAKQYEQAMSDGEAAFKTKNFAESEKAFSQALNAAKSFPASDQRTLKALNKQISVLYAEGKLADASPVIKQVIMIMEVRQGLDSAEVLESLKNYKLVLQRIGDSHKCDVVDNRISSLAKGGDGEHSHIANLIGSAITDDDAAFLLHGLEHEIWQLDAGNSQIGDKTMQLLKSFDHLERVDLSGTRISNPSLVNLKDKNTIRILTLDNTAVSDAGMPHLYSLKGLTHLGLSGTSVSASAITALKNALPRCKITQY